jgi:phosphatidylglycerol:prolipoprotein diacylglycerol transferase
MWPVLIEIGWLRLYSYGFMIAVGFLVGLHFIQRDAARRGFSPKVFTDMAFLALILGFLGTRAAHILMFSEQYSIRQPLGYIDIMHRGGLVFQGAIPVVLPFMIWYLHRHRIPFWPACDVVFPYIPLGHAFGRIGCFLYGCCYGKPTDVPWAIPARRVPWDLSQTPTGSPAYRDHLDRFSDMTADMHWSHPIHPTQLYEAASLALIVATMLFLRKRWHPFDGFLMPAYFMLYGALRFVVENYRGDHNPVRVLGLSDQQVASLVFVAFGLALFGYLRFRSANRANPGAESTEPRTPVKHT